MKESHKKTRVDCKFFLDEITLVDILLMSLIWKNPKNPLFSNHVLPSISLYYWVTYGIFSIMPLRCSYFLIACQRQSSSFKCMCLFPISLSHSLSLQISFSPPSSKEVGSLMDIKLKILQELMYVAFNMLLLITHVLKNKGGRYFH